MKLGNIFGFLALQAQGFHLEQDDANVGGDLDYRLSAPIVYRRLTVGELVQKIQAARKSVARRRAQFAAMQRIVASYQ